MDTLDWILAAIYFGLTCLIFAAGVRAWRRKKKDFWFDFLIAGVMLSFLVIYIWMKQT